MALPALFQRLADEKGWEVLRNHSIGMDEAYTVSNEALSFQEFKAKDTDRTYSVSKAVIGRRKFGVSMDPRKLASRMGFDAGDEVEAFEFIEKRQELAVRELDKFRIRSLYLEPILILPVVPLLILAVVPLIRNRILGIVGLWMEGPVRRLVD